MRQGIPPPESTFSADSLTVSAYSSHVQLHASTAVHTLKIPKHWQQYDCVDTRKHRQERVALLLLLLCLSQERRPDLPTRDREVTPPPPQKKKIETAKGKELQRTRKYYKTIKNKTKQKSPSLSLCCLSVIVVE